MWRIFEIIELCCWSARGCKIFDA